MKIEFDDLRLIEAKMLLDCLVAFRAGVQFSWQPPKEQSNVDNRRNSNLGLDRVSALAKSEGSNGSND